jgi:hypothetical protein
MRNKKVMKVKELIEILQKMPENMQVYAGKTGSMPDGIQTVTREKELGVVVINIK